MQSEQKPYILTRNSLLSHSISDYPDGIIIPVSKPYQWGSFDVVAKVKWLLRRFFSEKKIKVGHCGTLDPLATGVLLICVGKATKLAQALQDMPKEYLTTIVLGATTDSYDREQPISGVFPHSHIDNPQIDRVLDSMRGNHEQIPPLFSAKMIEGKRVYELARKGESVELKGCDITIYDIARLDDISALPYSQEYISQFQPYISENGDNTFVVKKRGYDHVITENSPLTPSEIEKLPRATIKTRCSKGTYIRSIARDIGISLGSGAYIERLCRTECGGIKIEQTLSIQELEQIFA